MAETRVGISGWRYEGWRKVFYPKGLPQRRELEFASREVNSIEINGSFYSLQHLSGWHQWFEVTPDDFVFSIKGPRFITHMKRLKEVETPLANFFASGLFLLKQKIGPILWQFPPHFKFNPEKFESFFELLPRDTKAALKLAKRHDYRLDGRDYLKIDANRPLRYAVEVRHDSFKCAEYIELLRKYNIANAMADAATHWPYMEDVTADFIYLRMHGEKALYSSGYPSKTLDRWAEKLKTWRKGAQIKNAVLMAPHKMPKRERDVYVYFDNDVKVRAPVDAVSLLERLSDFRPAFPLKRPVLPRLKQIYGPRVMPPKDDPRWNLGKKGAIKKESRSRAESRSRS